MAKYGTGTVVPVAGWVLAAYGALTIIDGTSVRRADVVTYENVGPHWQSQAAIDGAGNMTAVPAPHPWANPNGPTLPGPRR